MKPTLRLVTWRVGSVTFTVEPLPIVAVVWPLVSVHAAKSKSIAIVAPVLSTVIGDGKEYVRIA